MTFNTSSKTRTGPNSRNEDEIATRVAGRLTVAAVGGSDNVHLALIDDVERSSWTLCAQHVSREQPTSAFHDSGCWICASFALSTGYPVAEDRHGAMVGLKEWLARNRPLAAQRDAIGRL